MDPQKQFKEFQDSLAKVQRDLNELSGAYYKNNFISSQTFNKDCVFNSRLKVPHYTVAPTVSEVGDIIEVGGILYICTIAGGTFTKVGSQ